MAFYEDKRKHYGSACVLFKRNLAVTVPNAKTHRRANWYMRLKIGGRKGYVTRSTKFTIYEDSYEHSKSELLRFQQLQPSADALAVCVSKLNSYTQRLEGSSDSQAQAMYTRLCSAAQQMHDGTK